MIDHSIDVDLVKSANDREPSNFPSLLLTDEDGDECHSESTFVRPELDRKFGDSLKVEGACKSLFVSLEGLDYSSCFFACERIDEVAIRTENDTSGFGSIGGSVKGRRGRRGRGGRSGSIRVDGGVDVILLRDGRRCGREGSVAGL